MPTAHKKTVWFSLTALLLSTLIGLGTINANSVNDSKITVVSSIKPIQLITTSIIGDLGHSSLLLPASANPHHYQLRPSQRGILSNADLFIWVGPELELFLVKVLDTSSVNQISLIRALNIGGDSTHNEGNDHHDHHSAERHNSFDPHIWLSPAYTKKIAMVIYHELANAYPSLEPELKGNLTQFISQLEKAEDHITEQFQTENHVSIYTFHQAFDNFADHFGLEIAGTITRTPEARPGAKHLSKLTNEIREKKKICLVKEPNFKAPYVDSITKETKVVVSVADPLATEIDNSPTGYIEFIQAIANSFAKCLN